MGALTEAYWGCDGDPVYTVGGVAPDRDLLGNVYVGAPVGDSVAAPWPRTGDSAQDGRSTGHDSMHG